MAASQDHSSGPVPGPDQEPREPKPWPGPGLAWLPLQCQAFPSEPRSWAEMAGGPGLLPGSRPASQAPGQGRVAPCNHRCPGWPGQAGSPGQENGQHAALLWPEYPAGKGRMPRPPGASLDSSPIPGGQRGSKALGISLPPGAPASPLPLPLQTSAQWRWVPLPSPICPALCLHPVSRGGTSAGLDSSSLSKRGSTPVLILRDASLLCPRKGRVSAGAAGGRLSRTREETPFKPRSRSSPGAVVGRSCPAAPDNSVPRLRGPPLILQRTPTAAAQLPRRSLLPPRAGPRLGPATGRREGKREEKDTDGGTGAGEPAREGARASERKSERRGPSEGSQWPGARRGRRRGGRPTSPAAPAVPARQADPPARSLSPRHDARWLPTSAAGAPSSRNARAAPAGQRPQLRIRGGARRGSRPSTAPTSRTTPGWFPPCPRPQFPSRWNRDQVRTGAIRASARPPSWSQLLEQPASLA
ncbi:PREDICTED: collagen alpha-1(III) chain-like isoform X1 [Hipposideros armiger]|uniref:Collagen alpha-1(III) chain-like isoform X1 n=1 Tax=Hipposideros armiger TaxID=186990 RepID=A0A8B7SSV2_HIPAR|nr:PREDICTED: collagen alpha-1(III) chain-like isoform X1 [Hipposideros armiger]XP_019515829.1 PREDICTED: collagen alpha-1(III) chain-like isoform X1 [Hipposideros armiger]XP_019515830.1 PREDICTED: collagen alpha-1(III) chain-like isoform X1 [Hipposideros armiger]